MVQPPNAQGPIRPPGPLRWFGLWIRAMVTLPMMRHRLDEVARLTQGRIDALEQRVRALEGQSSSLISGRDGAERAQREEALLNQITSVPIALRELALRVSDLEAADPYRPS